MVTRDDREEAGPLAGFFMGGLMVAQRRVAASAIYMYFG